MKLYRHRNEGGSHARGISVGAGLLFAALLAALPLRPLELSAQEGDSEPAGTAHAETIQSEPDVETVDGQREPEAPPAPTPAPIPPISAEALSSFRIEKRPSFGGRIAFTVTAEGYHRILELDLDTGKVRPLIDGPGNNFYSDWSPDGERLVFVSDRDGNREIYLANWEGSEQTRLTETEEDEGDPSFASDGRRIVFYAEAPNSRETDIYELRTDGKADRRKLTELGGRNSTPRLSPDGMSIAYSTNRHWPGWDVCVWDLRTRLERCLLRGQQSYCRAAWSPNGERLIYSTGDGHQIDIGMLDMKSGTRTPVAILDLRDYDPVFAPDEHGVLFVSDTGHFDNFDLYFVEIEDGHANDPELILSSPYPIRYPSWSGRRTMELEALRIRSGDEGRIP